MTREEIAAFKLTCRGFDGKSAEKQVAPQTCRVCSYKMFCPSVQALLGAEAEYMKKFRGTILEKGMCRVGRLKKDVANYILGQYLE